MFSCQQYNNMTVYLPSQCKTCKCVCVSIPLFSSCVCLGNESNRRVPTLISFSTRSAAISNGLGSFSHTIATGFVNENYKVNAQTCSKQAQLTRIMRQYVTVDALVSVPEITGKDAGERILRIVWDKGNHWLQIADRRTLGSEWRESLAITFTPSDVTTLSTFSLSLVTQTQNKKTAGCGYQQVVATGFFV